MSTDEAKRAYLAEKAAGRTVFGIIEASRRFLGAAGCRQPSTCAPYGGYGGRAPGEFTNEAQHRIRPLKQGQTGLPTCVLRAIVPAGAGIRMAPMRLVEAKTGSKRP